MNFKIGFTAQTTDTNNEKTAKIALQQNEMPRRCVAQIYFANRNMTLPYYNDRFNLYRGDMVYVDGKLEGMLGRVIDVNYNFKIKMSDYKRVIAVVDTDVHGRFFMAGSHFVTFDRKALPYDKVLLWFKAPAADGDEFVYGSDDTFFRIDDLGDMNIDKATAERGHKYYLDNKVRYICLDGCKGYAIVEGSEIYEVEFEYQNGEISKLVCPCFCGGSCKHEFAAVLQLKETLGVIEKNYAAEYESAGYFAAVSKEVLFTFATDGKDTDTFTL